ncbi:MAG: hypothetical protein MI807_00760 [Verrucomicrobiales bacterium]|nr:hypothetical protein [Verrucomicrobiales bacterium]
MKRIQIASGHVDPLRGTSIKASCLSPSRFLQTPARILERRALLRGSELSILYGSTLLDR